MNTSVEATTVIQYGRMNNSSLMYYYSFDYSYLLQKMKINIRQMKKYPVNEYEYPANKTRYPANDIEYPAYDNEYPANDTEYPAN